MFRRRLLIGLLAFGTVAGYASGIASFGWHARACHDHRRERFEAHVADVCTRSAERVFEERRGGEHHHGRGFDARFDGYGARLDAPAPIGATE